MQKSNAVQGGPIPLIAKPEQSTEKAQNAEPFRDVCTLQGFGPDASIIVGAPLPDSKAEIYVIPGQKYLLSFQQGDVKEFMHRGGDLVIVLNNGATLVFKGYIDVMKADAPVTLSFIDALTPQEYEALLQISSSDAVADIEPAAGETTPVQALAQVEPAAGGAGSTPAGAARGGYGYQSSFDPQGVSPLADIGPIDPTALNYGVEFIQRPVRPVDAADAPAAAPPPNVPAVETDSLSVDESDLGGGNVVQNGQVVVDFGGDGPGQILPNGSFSADGSVANNTLTSNGVPVIVTATANGYVGTAGGVTIFTLTLDPVTGQYVFTLIGTLDHADGSDPDDVIRLQFGVTATDADGDQTTTTITVNVHDDGPFIDNRTRVVDEDSLSSGNPISVSGNLNHSYGADGAGQIVPTGHFVAMFEIGGQPQQITSGGVPVIVTPTANGYVGMAGGVVVFTLTVDANGNYTYEQFLPLDHPNTGDPDDIIWMHFGITIVDADGDEETAIIAIDVHDSGPEIGNRTKVVDEDTLSTGNPITVSGNVEHNYGVDGQGQIVPNNSFTAMYEIGGQPQQITSGGVPVVVTPTANGYVGMAGGVVVFTLTVDSNGNYTYQQFMPLDHPDTSDPDDIIWLHFGIKIVDGDGDEEDGIIAIDVHDSGPSIANKFAAVDEDTLLSHPINLNGNIQHNYGADGVGQIVPNGSFVALFQVGGSSETVTSGGVPVIVTMTENGYVGTANGQVVFTLVVNSDGTYNYRQFLPLDHPDTGHPNDIIWLQFGIKIIDADGDEATAIIAIDVHDSGPTIANKFAAVDEDTLLNHPINLNGNIQHNYGADGSGQIIPTGSFVAMFQMGGPSETVTSGGVPVIVTMTENGYIGMANGQVVFTLVVNSDGTYNYRQFLPLDHPPSDDPDSIIWLQFGIKIIDADGDEATAIIAIDVHDGAAAGAPPSINNATEVVDEDSMTWSQTMSVNGQMSHNYGSGGIGEIVPAGGFSAVYQPGGPVQQITSGGVPVIVTATANGYVGMANGEIVFTLTIDSNGNYTYEQFLPLDHPNGDDPNDLIRLRFGVKIINAAGQEDTAIIVIDVYDSAPLALNDIDKAHPSPDPVVGNVFSNDNIGADKVAHPLTQVEFNGVVYNIPPGGSVTVEGNYGTLVIHSDGTYAYTCHSDQGSDVFTYTITDGDGDTSQATLTFLPAPPPAPLMAGDPGDTGGTDGAHGGNFHAHKADLLYIDDLGQDVAFLQADAIILHADNVIDLGDDRLMEDMLFRAAGPENDVQKTIDDFVEAADVRGLQAAAVSEHIEPRVMDSHAVEAILTDALIALKQDPQMHIAA